MLPANKTLVSLFGRINYVLPAQKKNTLLELFDIENVLFLVARNKSVGIKK